MKVFYFLCQNSRPLWHFMIEYKKFNFIMTWENGKYVHPNYYTLKFRKVLNNLNFEKNIRFHDLRHTNASLLLEQGIDFKVIQTRLGHSDINTTLNIYSHINLKMQKNRCYFCFSLISSFVVMERFFLPKYGE